MRAFVSLGLAASLLACAVPAMAQSDLRFGNGGGHAMGGGGHRAGGNAGAPNNGAFRPSPGGGGFRQGGGGFRQGGGQQGFRQGGGRQYGGDYRRHGDYGGAAVGAGIAGLAAGALIGGAIANQDAGYGYGYGYDNGYAPPPPPRVYYDEDAENVEPAPVGGGEVAYCMNRYRSYDPASGTYLGFDGLRHPCP